MKFKNIKPLQYMLILLVFALTISCKKDKEEQSTNIELTEKIWTLYSAEHSVSHFISYFPDISQKITLEFGTNKNLVINGICNAGTASYAIADEKISFTSVHFTKIFCDNADWENITIKSLQDAKSYEISNGTLIIYSNNEYNLVFK